MKKKMWARSLYSYSFVEVLRKKCAFFLASRVSGETSANH